MMKPEDMLGDNEDFFALKNGVKIRKGTMGALIANIEIIDDEAIDSIAYQEAVKDFKAALMPVCELGLLKHFEVKSPRVRAIINKR